MSGDELQLGVGAGRGAGGPGGARDSRVSEGRPVGAQMPAGFRGCLGQVASARGEEGSAPGPRGAEGRSSQLRVGAGPVFSGASVPCPGTGCCGGFEPERGLPFAPAEVRRLVFPPWNAPPPPRPASVPVVRSVVTLPTGLPSWELLGARGSVSAGSASSSLRGCTCSPVASVVGPPGKI